jgi:hypothetical protein
MSNADVIRHHGSSLPDWATKRKPNDLTDTMRKTKALLIELKKAALQEEKVRRTAPRRQSKYYRVRRS